MYTLTAWPGRSCRSGSARPARLGAISMKTPYSSTLRTMPTTVSPAAKQAAFSLQVPSSSRSVSTIRSWASRLFTAHSSCWPTCTRSAGEAMRDTDKQSMGSSAEMPHPTSQKAPKLSMWVTVQGITLPNSSASRYSVRQRRWASARDRRYTVSPPSSRSVPTITKQVGRPTRVSTAMSLTVSPGAWSTQSSNSIYARCPHSVKRSRRLVSKARAVACRTSADCRQRASSSSVRWLALRHRPSARYSSICVSSLYSLFRVCGQSTVCGGAVGYLGAAPLFAKTVTWYIIDRQIR